MCTNVSVYGYVLVGAVSLKPELDIRPSVVWVTDAWELSGSGVGDGTQVFNKIRVVLNFSKINAFGFEPLLTLIKPRSGRNWIIREHGFQQDFSQGKRSSSHSLQFLQPGSPQNSEERIEDSTQESLEVRRWDCVRTYLLVSWRRLWAGAFTGLMGNWLQEKHLVSSESGGIWKRATLNSHMVLRRIIHNRNERNTESDIVAIRPEEVDNHVKSWPLKVLNTGQVSACVWATVVWSLSWHWIPMWPHNTSPFSAFLYLSL